MKQTCLIIGAATSGSGKTTFTMGLLRALCNRGLSVQPFKCGPDYIDILFHRQAAGRESVNLDTFLSSPEHVRHLFAHYGSASDACVVEGVMGLYDGYQRDFGSTAHIASVLDIPVILLVNARSVAYSVAPLIHGFHTFASPATGNRRLSLSGVVFNNVASERHYDMLRAACLDAGVPCLGYLPRNPLLQIPSRHLGLSISEVERTERLIQVAASEVEAHVDIDAILASCQCLSAPSSRPSISLSPSARRICVARDEAFNFIYRANLDALSRKAHLTFFSPLRDAQLPPCHMLYLPGGYPELFARQLADNASMRRSIRSFAERGGRIFAECGGFMYLCRDIDAAPMCDVFPFSATMKDPRLHLGYRFLPCSPSPLCGHEFHYSSASGMPDPQAVYHYKNVLAGYPHWYWAEHLSNLHP